MSNEYNLLFKRILSFFIILIHFVILFAFSGETSQVEKDIQRIFKTSFDSAEAFLKKGEYQNSIVKFQEVLSLAEELDYVEGIIQSYMRLGVLYWNTGELEKSTQLYKQALSLEQNHTKNKYAVECQKSLEIYLRYSEGKEYRSSGNYLKSIESFEKAIKLAKEIGSIAHEVKCLRQMSISYWDTNDFQNFSELNQIALKLALNLNNKREEFNSLNNIGLYQKKNRKLF